VRIILQKLSKKELAFLLQLLNSAGAATEIEHLGNRRIKAVVSVAEASSLDRAADRLRVRYEKNRVPDEIRPKGAYFASPARARSEHDMVNEWSHARIPAVSATVYLRDRPGSFVHVLIVGVPAHHPPVMVNDPRDLVSWMVARGMANGQLKRLVKCKLPSCGKFGLRDRAKKDARFHSRKCQQEYNLLSRKVGGEKAMGKIAW
jgi:hypothetical protein